MEQSPYSGQKPLTASASLAATAKISATLGRTERGVLLMGGFFALVAIVALICETVHPSVLNDCALAVGLAGLIGVASIWFYLTKTSADPETPPTALEMRTPDGHETTLRSASISPDQIIQLMRQVSQPRAHLPNPFGELKKGGDPSSNDDYVTYDPAQREKAGMELRESVRQQEAEISEKIRNLIQHHREVSLQPSNPETASASELGMCQAEDSATS